MLRGFRFAAWSFCFAVAGCSTTSDTQTEPHSRTPMPVACEAGSACPVQVAIEHWPTQCFFICEVIVTNEVIVHDANKLWKQPITWEIPADSHVRFADDGIAFKRDADFPCKPEAARGEGREASQRFTCANNGKPGRYEYAVHLKWGLLSFRLDPWIVNR